MDELQVVPELSALYPSASGFLSFFHSSLFLVLFRASSSFHLSCSFKTSFLLLLLLVTEELFQLHSQGMCGNTRVFILKYGMHLLWLLRSFCRQSVSCRCLTHGWCLLVESCTKALCSVCSMLSPGEAASEAAALNGCCLRCLMHCWKLAGYYSNKWGLRNLVRTEEMWRLVNEKAVV